MSKTISRVHTDWKSTRDAEQKANTIAAAYFTKVKNYKPGGGKVTGSVPKAAGPEGQKGLLAALYDAQKAIGVNMQYVQQTYLK